MGGFPCCCNQEECCWCNQCDTCIGEWDVTITGFGDTETSEGYGCWDCDRFDDTYTLSRPDSITDLVSPSYCNYSLSNCQWTWESDFDYLTDSHSLAADCLQNWTGYGDFGYIAWIKQIRLQVFTDSYYGEFGGVSYRKAFRLGITAAKVNDSGGLPSTYGELWWKWIPTKSDGTYYGSSDILPCSSYDFSTTPDWESAETYPTYPCDPDDVTFTIEVGD